MINRVLSQTAAGYFRLQGDRAQNAEQQYGNYIDQRQDQYGTLWLHTLKGLNGETNNFHGTVLSFTMETAVIMTQTSIKTNALLRVQIGAPLSSGLYKTWVRALSCKVIVGFIKICL